MGNGIKNNKAAGPSLEFQEPRWNQGVSYVTPKQKGSSTDMDIQRDAMTQNQEV